MGDASEKHDLPDDPVLLKALIHEQELRIAVLEEKLRLAIHKRFGASSEKADPDQLGAGAEALVDREPQLLFEHGDAQFLLMNQRFQQHRIVWQVMLFRCVTHASHNN